MSQRGVTRDETTCNFLNTEDLQEDIAEKALDKDEEGNYG